MQSQAVSELRSVVLPAIDKQNDELLEKAEQEYEAAATLERRCIGLFYIDACPYLCRVLSTFKNRAAKEGGPRGAGLDVDGDGTNR